MLSTLHNDRYRAPADERQQASMTRFAEFEQQADANNNFRYILHDVHHFHTLENTGNSCIFPFYSPKKKGIVLRQHPYYLPFPAGFQPRYCTISSAILPASLANRRRIHARVLAGEQRREAIACSVVDWMQISIALSTAEPLAASLPQQAVSGNNSRKALPLPPFDAVYRTCIPYTLSFVFSKIKRCCAW
jgi:hypothetical protein